MSEIFATVKCPAAQVNAARQIGGDQWAFGGQFTTDPAGALPVTHYISSGSADAGLLALIAMIAGVVVSFDSNPYNVLAEWELYPIAEEL